MPGSGEQQRRGRRMLRHELRSTVTAADEWVAVQVGHVEWWRDRDWPLCPVRRDGAGALCRLVYPHDGEHEWEVDGGG